MVCHCFAEAVPEGRDRRRAKIVVTPPSVLWFGVAFDPSAAKVNVPPSARTPSCHPTNGSQSIRITSGTAARTSFVPGFAFDREPRSMEYRVVTSSTGHHVELLAASSMAPAIAVGLAGLGKGQDKHVLTFRCPPLPYASCRQIPKKAPAKEKATNYEDGHEDGLDSFPQTTAFRFRRVHRVNSRPREGRPAADHFSSSRRNAMWRFQPASSVSGKIEPDVRPALSMALDRRLDHQPRYATMSAAQPVGSANCRGST